MILVDTDVWIDFFTGVEPSSSTVTRLLVEKRAALASTTVFELYAGVEGKRRLSQLDALSRVVPIVSFTGEDARRAGRLYTKLKNRGQLVGNQDLFLASIALESGLPVLTRNLRHFSRIADLEVLSPEDVS